jgi:histidinol-phosphate aminotransferase
MENFINKRTEFWLKNIPKRYIVEKSEKNIQLRFDGGESFLPKIRNLKPVLKMLRLEDLTQYPIPDFKKLRQAIAHHEGISINNISIGSGCDSFIENLPRILLNPHDKVIVIEPTFFRFIESSTRQEADIIRIKLKGKNNFKFTLNTANEIIKVANKKNVKLIWICNPNNPTGQITKPEILEKIIDNVNSIIIIDETLHGFVNPENFPSSSQFIKTHKNIIVIKSLSKVFGLAGIRVGWAIAHEDIISLLEKFRFPYEVTTLSSKIAQEVLKRNHIAIIRKRINAERIFIEKRLTRLVNIEFCKGSLTNIVLLRHKQKDLFKKLLLKGILTADFRESNGLNGKGFIRISVQNRRKNKLLLKALEEID